MTNSISVIHITDLVPPAYDPPQTVSVMETMMYDKYLETVYPHSEASPSVCVDNDIKSGRHH